MAFWRLRLRRFAVTWLMFQVASVAAIVPRDCCAAHRPADKKCHASVSETHCPMRGADGKPCPMHRLADQQQAHHQVDSAEHDRHHSTPAARCRLRATCDGSMAALALMSNHGILSESTAASRIFEVAGVTSVLFENPLGRRQPPDPPPPRA